MQSHFDCIIHSPVCFVGKLKRIQQESSDVLQVGQDQSFKWLHDHRDESDSSVVIFGDQNDSGAFEAAGNFTQLQWSVEYLCEDGGGGLKKKPHFPHFIFGLKNIKWMDTRVHRPNLHVLLHFNFSFFNPEIKYGKCSLFFNGSDTDE